MSLGVQGLGLQGLPGFQILGTSELGLRGIKEFRKRRCANDASHVQVSRGQGKLPTCFTCPLPRGVQDLSTLREASCLSYKEVRLGIFAYLFKETFNLRHGHSQI